MDKKILPNGLRLILVSQPQSLATTVLILVAAGSEYETRHQNGISHFLEHLVFKGTLDRPKPGAIAAELDALGAEYNAFTGQEYTGYWAKAQNHKLPQILDLVSDLYVNPVFNAAEIEKERGVIIEEINMYEDTPMRRVEELYISLLYGDQPAGWDIAGRKDVVRKLKREDFIRYRARHYVPQATTVVVSGAFNKAKIITLVKKLFGGLGRGRKAPRFKTQERQTRPAMRIKFKKSDQSHMVLGVRAFDIFDPRRYTLSVLAEILGGGMSSRLFIKVREEMGAAYHIRAASDLFLDHGFFQVSAGVDHKKIDKVIPAILQEFSRLRREAVPPQELRKAKDHMIGGLILGLETSDEQAAFYGSQEILTGKMLQPGEIIRRVDKVSAGDIRRLARTIFREDKLNLAVIGPYKKEKLLRQLLRLP